MNLDQHIQNEQTKTYELYLCMDNGDLKTMSVAEYIEYLELDGADTVLDKMRGTTNRVKTYCMKHGLDSVPDLNRIWKTTKKRNYIWRIKQNGKNRKNR